MDMSGFKLNGRKLVLSFAKERAFRTEVPSDEKIAQFQGITGLPLEESLQFLVAAKWNVEVRLRIAIMTHSARNSNVF